MSANEPGSTDAPLIRLRVLHDRVALDAGVLAEAHRPRLSCRRGCHACCRDGLTVLRIEAEEIRSQYGELLSRATPRPVGQCAFLDDHGACRIYAARPYVCRTQGLPLRFFEEDENEEVIERRTICELNAPGPELDELDEESLWLIGPMECELLDLEEARFGSIERVALRDLFTTEK